MTPEVAAERLRIYVGESDKVGGKLVHQTLVEHARAQGLAGATVFRGVEGFGAHRQLHVAKVLQLSENLPVVVELIDVPEKLDAFLAAVAGTLARSFATREPVRMIHFADG